MNIHYKYIYYVATVAILHFDGQMFQRPIAHGPTNSNEQTAVFLYKIRPTINIWKLHFYVARAQFRLLFEDATMPTYTRSVCMHVRRPLSVSLGLMIYSCVFIDAPGLYKLKRYKSAEVCWPYM